MRTIVLSFEWHCYPIWVYDEEYMVDYNDFLDEWEEDKTLDKKDIKAKLDELQDLYDFGFINNPTTFEFVGFQGDTKRMNRLNTLLDEVRSFIKEHLPEGYVFEDRVINHNQLKGF